MIGDPLNIKLQQAEQMLTDAIFLKKYPYRDKLLELIRELLCEQFLLEDCLTLSLKIIEINTNNPSHFSQILNMCKLLNKSGFTFNECKDLYLKALQLIKWNHDSTEIFNVCNCIQELGISYKEHKGIYLTLIHDASSCNELLKSKFEELKINFSQNLLPEIISHLLSVGSYYYIILAQSFISLHQAGLSFEKNKPLYKALSKNRWHIETLTKGFLFLHNCGITIDGEFKKLYHNLISRAEFTNGLREIFDSLLNAGITPDNFYDFYLHIINHPFNSDKVLLGFNALIQAEMPYPENKTLYHLLVTSPENAEYLFETLNLLTQCGLTYRTHPQHFNQHTLITHHKMTVHVINSLSGLGYTIEHHAEIFNLIFTMLSSQHCNYQILTKIIETLRQFQNNNTLTTSESTEHDSQVTHLLNLIDAQSNYFDSLLQGPLNKSQATILIEKLVERISEGTLDLGELISFDSYGHYILTIPGYSQINLSLLIYNANLSQLVLSEPLVEKLYTMVNQLIQNKIIDPQKRWFRNIFDSPVIKLLPKAQQNVIAIYATKYHININKFFRSETLDDDNAIIFNSNPGKNMLVCFLLGVLLNDVARKINTLIDRSTTKRLIRKITSLKGIDPKLCVHDKLIFKKLLSDCLDENIITQAEYNVLFYLNLSHFFPSGYVYDRGEIISDEIIARRTTNPHVLTSQTSISARKEGSPYFHKEGTTRIIINENPYFGIINDNEDEVLIPQGECMITSRGSEGLVSTLVRSPSLEHKNHYWSMLALLEAQKYYLSKRYKDVSHQITIQRTVIERPNHDMSHTQRVMDNIEQVIDYFSLYSNDLKFKTFCQSITDIEIEWLRVASAFSVTGRESEISPKENLARYNEFRAASAKHFSDFVLQSASSFNQDMYERLSHIIQHSNPNYENITNTHPNTEEKQCRDFFNRIYTIAHKLDLPRCYNAEEFDHSMQLCRDLSEGSDAQQNAYHHLIRYNIDRIKAHGCRLSCDIALDGTLFNVKLGYQDRFAEASSNMKRLQELTQLAPKPIKTPPPVIIEAESSSTAHSPLSDDEAPFPANPAKRLREHAKRSSFSSSSSEISSHSNLNKRQRNRHFSNTEVAQMPILFFALQSVSSSSISGTSDSFEVTSRKRPT